MMNWFQKLSARAKLLLAFIAVSAILGGVAAFALFKMGTINDSLSVLASRDVVGMHWAYEANLDMAEMRKVVRDALLETKPEAIHGKEDRRRQVRGGVCRGLQTGRADPDHRRRENRDGHDQGRLSALHRHVPRDH